MALLLLAGLSAYRSLGRDEDPPFTMKVMIVSAMWPGADAEQTAKQLTDRMEKALESLQWLDVVTSYTKPGESTLFVNLMDRTPPQAVPDQWYQVRKKIGDIAYTLPQGTVGPFYDDDFGDVYGVIYALTSDGFSYRELRDTRRIHPRRAAARAERGQGGPDRRAGRGTQRRLLHAPHGGPRGDPRDGGRHA